MVGGSLGTRLGVYGGLGRGFLVGVIFLIFYLRELVLFFLFSFFVGGRFIDEVGRVGFFWGFGLWG